MILTMDVGNTNIKTAVFEKEKMLQYWRISTNLTYTSDEYGMILDGLFRRAEIQMEQMEGIMISSVVPTINFTLEHMCQNYFHQKPMFVAPGIRTGIDLKYENPRELGSDRIANAVAAQAEYGSPCIFIDFGTATTFGAIDQSGAFLGGCICPGLKLTSEALVAKAAKLPRFELVCPDSVIGRTTVTNLQAGAIYGYIGQVDYLIKLFKKELKAPRCPVVTTGGMARLIIGQDHVVSHFDGILTLKGLRILYERNH